MRIKLTKFALTLMLTLASGSAPALASSTNGYGKIAGVYATQNGAVLFNLHGATQSPVARDAVPACASGMPNRWAIDASSVSGQAVLHTLLWAIEITS